MSVETLAMVLHHSRADGTDKVVLIGIANHDGDGGAWPGLSTLARYARRDERTVRRSLRRLEQMGELQTYTQAGGPSGIPEWKRPNRYEVLVACPATCDRTKNHREIKLPAAPADLWTTGGTPTSPGGTHVPGGGTPTSPGVGTPTSPEPSIEPSTKTALDSESQLQTARDLADRSALVRCSVCDRERHDCEARTQVSGHEFSPRPLRSVR